MCWWTIGTLYHYLVPELRRICDKYGVEYVYEDSVVQAVWAYHKWLWLMGSQLLHKPS